MEYILMYGILQHYKKPTINAALIEVYEGFDTSDKQNFLIAVNFKAESQVKIIVVMEKQD